MLEENVPLPAGDVDGWCGQRLFARALENDPHLSHEGQIGVGEQGYAQGQFLCGFRNRCGLFAADGEQMVPELRKLSCDFFQLDQLVAAESSPAAAVEHEDGRLRRDGAAEVETLTLSRLQLRCRY